jgi:hypothetical protein
MVAELPANVPDVGATMISPGTSGARALIYFLPGAGGFLTGAGW